jgi:hypothetical protein
LKFTPEKSAALGDFAVCGRRPGLSALDLTSFLKKAGPKTFAFASRFQECFFDRLKKPVFRSFLRLAKRTPMCYNGYNQSS